MFSLLDRLKEILIHMAPGMPTGGWVITACILGALGLAALIDIFTGRIPDILIFFALAIVVGTQGMFGTWNLAAFHLAEALIAGFIIWIANEIWYRILRQDALGMGDAKWTILAVACFGLLPALFAWGLGAVLAVIFILAADIAQRKIARVTFAPFLFTGLCVGIYIVRFTQPENMPHLYRQLTVL